MKKKLLYDAGRQRIKVRLMLLFALAVAALALVFGLDLVRTYGLRSADGGVLAPLPVRLAWGGGVAAAGLVFAGGMLLYARLYISRISLDTATGTVCFHTLSWLGERSAMAAVSDFHAGRYHEGRLDLPRAPSVRAPWIFVRMPGRRLPFVLDAQGVILDARQLRRILRFDLAARVRLSRRGRR